jgi:hypothetical protein
VLSSQPAKNRARLRSYGFSAIERIVRDQELIDLPPEHHPEARRGALERGALGRVAAVGVGLPERDHAALLRQSASSDGAMAAAS